jgi:DNA-binding transcriptional LysR family regulator
MLRLCGSAESLKSTPPHAPDTDRLVRRGEANLAALAKHPVILFPRALSPDKYDDLVGYFVRAGLRPKVIDGPPGIRATLEAVGRREGISVVPKIPAQVLARGEVTLLPLADVVTAWSVVMVYRRGNASPVVTRFVELLRDRLPLHA